MRYEILISENLYGFNSSPNIYLDTFDDESVSLNYNIADVTDLSAKNSSYSKTIKLPDTGRNRQAFSNIFSVEAISPIWSGNLPVPVQQRSFNPTKKVRCLILQDTITIFSGNIQLTNIVYDYNRQAHFYETVVYADNDTLFKVIGEQYLSDLNLSRYDHIWNVNNIKNSWGSPGNGSYTNGYFYPLIDYGFPFDYNYTSVVTNTIRYDRLYPAFYAKIIFDQIFSEAGFSYTSDFLNSERFTELIVPFSNKNLVTRSQITTDTNNNIFVATRSSDFSIYNELVDTDAGYTSIYWNSLNCNADTFDPNNFYDTANSKFINTTSKNFRQGFTINFKIECETPNPGELWVNKTDDIKLWVKRSKSENGATNPSWSNTPTYDQLTNPSNPNYFRDVLINGAGGVSLRNVLIPNSSAEVTFPLNNLPIVDGQFSTDSIFYPIRPGEEVRFFISRSIVNISSIYLFDIKSGTSIKSTLDPNTAVFGSDLYAKDFIATKVKQKDFLMSIFKMFNLYIEPSNEVANNFIIEPRDEYYYKYQVAKDWSDKLDLGTEVNSEILSNTQKRTNLFTYKADKDYYNTDYTTNTNEIFGQFKFEVDNDFISGDNKIEPIFSPTPTSHLPNAPIVNNNSIYTPMMYNYNNGNYTKPDGMNIRILWRKMVLMPPNVYFKISNPDTATTDVFANYPYAGFSNDPINPNYSLNFGYISPYVAGYIETPNNLFNT
jgi:hypothetical protein